MFRRTDWMLDYQGMVCLAANQVWWTAEVENVFEKLKQVRCFTNFEFNSVYVGKGENVINLIMFYNKLI